MVRAKGLKHEQKPIDKCGLEDVGKDTVYTMYILLYILFLNSANNQDFLPSSLYRNDKNILCTE